MIVATGPSGSGKSRGLLASETGFDYFNIDDRAAAPNSGAWLLEVVLP
jgi:hypothetical protein